LSTTEEIQAEFDAEIREKTKIVLNTQGIQAFLDLNGMQIHDLFEGTSLTTDAKELLQKIVDAEAEDVE
jgi:hypothetical protein